MQNYAYNCSFVPNIESFLLNAEKLISALKFICSRHEVLRSTYHDGLPSLQGEDHRVLSLIYRQKIHPRDRLGPIYHVTYLELPYTKRNKETILASIVELGARLSDSHGRDQLSASGEYTSIHHIATDERGF
jgi:hypothetical protein